MDIDMLPPTLSQCRAPSAAAAGSNNDMTYVINLCIYDT